MKNIYLLLVLLVGAMAFTACSDDDNNDSGSSKKISRIVETYSEDGIVHKDTTNFTYTNGKLSNVNGVSIAYSTDKIVLTDEEDVQTIYLKDGKAAVMVSSYQYNNIETSRDSSFFTYGGGYLMEINTDEYYVSKYQGSTIVEKDGLGVKETYTVTNKNFVGVKQEYFDEPSENMTFTFGYEGAVANNTNINLFSFVGSMGTEEMPMLLGVAGQKGANLPTKVKVKSNDETTDLTIHYTKEKDLITKVILKDATGAEQGSYEVFYN